MKLSVYALTISVSLGLGALLAGCVVPIPVPVIPTPSEPTVSPEPTVSIVGMLPQTSVEYGQEFEMWIVVRNSGDAPAEDLHVYLRVQPSGYFEVLSANRSMEPLSPAGVRFSLGALSPGDREEIRLLARAPTQDQMNSRYGINFEFTLTYDYTGATEEVGDRFAATVAESGPVFLVLPTIPTATPPP